MSKPTLEQAIRGTVINETVIFASKAGYEHCSNGIRLKQGPQNLFRMVNDPLVLTPSMDNPLEVEVVGTVTDVCIVVFAVAVAYSSDVSGTTIHATMDYLQDKYGFSFKSTYGTVSPALDLTPEHIERILGKEKAKEFNVDNVALTFTKPFTPNEHSVTPIPTKVTEAYAFQEFNPFDKGSHKLAAKNFLETAPVDYLDGAVYGSIEITGEPLDVCACIIVFMEIEGAFGSNKKNVLDNFKEKYKLDPELILNRAQNLSRSYIEGGPSRIQPKKIFKGLDEPSVGPIAEEIYTFVSEEACSEGFEYACQIGDVCTTRVGDKTVILRGPVLKVCALLATFSDLVKPEPAQTERLLAGLEVKYSVDRKDIIRTIQLNYVTRRIPGMYRRRAAGINKDLILRHFVQKSDDDVETELEKKTEAEYDEVKDLFIRLRDKDVSLAEKEILLDKFASLAGVSVLIIALEKHLQDTSV